MWAGYPRADGIVGLLIGVMVIGLLISSMRTVVRRLMDGVEEGVVDQMTRTAGAVEGVAGVNRIRARWTGTGWRAT